MGSAATPSASDADEKDGADAAPRDGRVSLRWVELDSVAEPAIGTFERQLSLDERRRAGQLARPLDRRRFVAARGSLRRVLAQQLGCSPPEVPIVHDERGKPGVADSELRFSTAASAGLALHALSWSIEVGVDIELIDPGLDVDRFAARFFSAGEQRELAALPPAQRAAAAFRCWTRKEAYAKAVGDGLSFPLGAMHVGLGGSSTVGDGWSVHQLDVAPGFAAAVAGSAVGGWLSEPPRRIDIDRPALVPARIAVDRRR